MKNKGFTLVELLAVVVMIGIVSILVMPKILERFENKKLEISDEAKKLLYIAADQYMSQNPDTGKRCVTIGELIDSGQLVEPVLDVKTNTSIPNTSSIKVTFNNNQYNYEFSEEGCLFNIDYVLENVTMNKNVTSISKGEKIELFFSSNEDYSLPSSINVIGAEYTWDKNTGKLELNEVLNDITIKISGISVFVDKTPPIVNVTEEDGNVKITVKDEGESGLSNDNTYQYYLSTSALEQKNGEWIEYTSEEWFTLETNRISYLWVYPVKDKAGNISDNKTFEEPYVIKKIGKTEITENPVYEVVGTTETIVIPYTGVYKMELWGSQGGSYADIEGAIGGKGAYTSGYVYLEKGETIYVTSGTSSSARTTATDIRYGASKLYDRIMVAGNGGGASDSGKSGNSAVALGSSGRNGSQTMGGYRSVSYSGTTITYNNQGSFGTGRSGNIGTIDSTGTYYVGGSGGAGYYGGGGGYVKDGGGGGSSFISGYLGCVAIAASSSTTPKEGCTDGTTDIQCSYHYSGKIFYDTQIIAGSNEMPSPTGGTEIGHEGDGFARIKYIGEGFSINLEHTNKTISSTETKITIDAHLPLSESNQYQYYLSESATELIGGSWKSYSNGEKFMLEGKKSTYYLWIYPLADINGIINDDNLSITKPYVLGTIKMY